MSARAGSVRARLVAIVLGGLAVAWVAVTIAVVVKADHEIEEVFDANLAQHATLLVIRLDDDLDRIDADSVVPQHKYQKPLSFQVWKHGTRLMVHSADVPPTRLSTKETGYSTVYENGENWRVFGLWDPKHEYLVQVRDALDDRRHVILDIVKGLAVPLVIAPPLFALLVWVGTGRALRPLARVSAEIARRDPGYLDPLEGEVPGEIAPVVERLNELLARLRDSLESERRFTADAAHELRTPLAALRAHVQVAQGARDEAERAKALAGALAGVERATHVAEQLLTLARLEQGAWKEAAEPFDLRRLAAECVADRAGAAATRRIALALDGETKATARGHAGLVAIALGNLLDNAIRYTTPGTEVVVTIAPAGGGWELSVTDAGPGIPAGQREEALKRFARLGRESAEGSGLGLSIVSRVAQLHGSELRLADGPGGSGLAASLRLPA